MQCNVTQCNVCLCGPTQNARAHTHTHTQTHTHTHWLTSAFEHACCQEGGKKKDKDPNKPKKPAGGAYGSVDSKRFSRLRRGFLSPQPYLKESAMGHALLSCLGGILIWAWGHSSWNFSSPFENSCNGWVNLFVKYWTSILEVICDDARDDMGRHRSADTDPIVCLWKSKAFLWRRIERGCKKKFPRHGLHWTEQVDARF